MVLSSYDGINVTMLMDGIGVKVIRSLLEQVTGDMTKVTASELQTDWHPYDDLDVLAVATQFILATRKLAENLHERPAHLKSISDTPATASAQ